MTQEEKAKAFDEALEKARKELGICGSLDCDAARQIFRFFPKLAESEDVKIIDGLKGLLRGIRREGGLTLNKVPIEKCEAWLEKQKESLHIPETSKENANSFTDEDERIRKILLKMAKVPRKEIYEHEGITKEQAISYLEKQKELDKMIIVSPEVWDNAISDAYKNGKKDNEKQKDTSKAIEAVDRIDKYIDEHLSAESCKDASKYIDTIISKLPESENERMWEQIIRGFKNWKSNGHLAFNCLPVDDIISWLEKQKELDYLNKFTKLPHLNSDYEVVDDWAYTPSLCHCDGNWAVCWIHCEDGDVLHECIGDTPAEAIDKAVEWFTSLNKQIPVKEVGAIISSRDKEETACGYLERCLTPDMRKVWYEACDELKKVCFQEAEKQKEQKPNFDTHWENGSMVCEQKEPHYTKRNALFDKCVENCDPEVMKEVSDYVDKMLEPKIAFGDWGDKEKKEAIITCLQYMRFIKKITNQEYDDLAKWLDSNLVCNLEIPEGDVTPEEDGSFNEDKFLERELSAFLQNYDKEYDDDAAVSDVARHFYEIGKKQKEQKELPLMNGDADLYFDNWIQHNDTTKRGCFEEGMRYTQRLQKEQKSVVTHGETYHVDTLGTQQVIAGKMPQKPYEPKNWPADKDNMTQEQKPADDKAFEEWIDDWWKHNKVNNPDSYNKGDEIQFDEQGFKNFCRGIRNMYAEQKPAEWSEEDEAFLKVAIAICNRYSHKDVADWLKSLRPQSKKELSIEKAIQWLDDTFYSSGRGQDCEITTHDFDSLEEMYDSFRKAVTIDSQPSWKPSEEQMSALERASTNEYLSAKQYDILVSLHEQLKKL